MSAQTESASETTRPAVFPAITDGPVDHRQKRPLGGLIDPTGDPATLLVAYFHIVRDQAPVRELGPDWQPRRYSVEHRAQRLQRQLKARGYAITL